MAQGTIYGSVGAHSDSYSYYIDWIEDNVNVDTNTSRVRAWVHVSCSNHSAYQNNCAQNLYINGVHFSNTLTVTLSAGANVELVYGETTITHNDDGTKTINISANGTLPYGSGWGPNSGSASGNITLETIPRYAGFNGCRIDSIGLTSVDIAYNSNKNLYAAESSINGQSWQPLEIVSGTWNAANNTVIYRVSGLTPKTNYNIQTRIATVAGLWTYSDVLNFTTLDYAKINTLPNFNHGSNVVANITNPANISNLKLSMKIGTTQILTRNVVTGNNTITFTDTELDNIYKKFENATQLTATFVLTGSEYTNSKTCTITLIGNQKVIRTNLNSSWKRGKLWTNVNGSWKRCVVWTNVNGNWKRGI